MSSFLRWQSQCVELIWTTFSPRLHEIKHWDSKKAKKCFLRVFFISENWPSLFEREIKTPTVTPMPIKIIKRNIKIRNQYFVMKNRPERKKFHSIEKFRRKKIFFVTERLFVSENFIRSIVIRDLCSNRRSSRVRLTDVAEKTANRNENLFWIEKIEKKIRTTWKPHCCKRRYCRDLFGNDKPCPYGLNLSLEESGRGCWNSSTNFSADCSRNRFDLDHRECKRDYQTVFVLNLSDHSSCLQGHD